MRLLKQKRAILQSLKRNIAHAVSNEKALAKAHFADRNLSSLIRSLMVYQYCSYPKLVAITPRLLRIGHALKLTKPMEWILRRTAFAQFCGGEDAKETKETIERLSKKGLYSILDLSIEADVVEDLRSVQGDLGTRLQTKYNKLADDTVAAISLGLNEAKKVKHTFYAVKCTALVSDPRSLEYWSWGLRRARWEFDQAVRGNLTSTVTSVYSQDSLLHRAQWIAANQAQCNEQGEAFNEEFDPKWLENFLTERTIDLSTFKKVIKKYNQKLDVKECEKIFLELDRSGRGRLDWIDFQRVFQPEFMNTYGVDLLSEEVVLSGSNDLPIAQNYRKIYPSTKIEVLASLDRLHSLCQTAFGTFLPGNSDNRIPPISQYPVRLMIDAEQSYLQPAIHYLTKNLVTRYNCGQNPFVYDTYQLYKKNGLRELVRDFIDASRGKRVWAGKLVRGAYVVQERDYARKNGIPSSIWETKNETDKAYNIGVNLAIAQTQKELSDKQRADAFKWGRLMVASHNHFSVFEAMEKLKGFEDGQVDPKSWIIFAQLYGMGELLGADLLSKGYKVAKYVPYGPIEKVVPYLVRRAEENSAVLGEFGKAKEVTGSGAGEDRRAVLNVLKEWLISPPPPPPSSSSSTTA